MEKSNREWHGETGVISKAMLLKFIDDLTLPIYYINGPSAMVIAMRQILRTCFKSVASGSSARRPERRNRSVQDVHEDFEHCAT